MSNLSTDMTTEAVVSAVSVGTSQYKYLNRSGDTRPNYHFAKYHHAKYHLTKYNVAKKLKQMQLCQIRLRQIK